MIILHHITSEIVKREPSFICIEDLNVKGNDENRHLSKAVQQQFFFMNLGGRWNINPKWNNIQVIIADRFFPSSKLCSCWKDQKDLKLSERIYKCECGNVVDRDLQAALNLKIWRGCSETICSITYSSDYRYVLIIVSQN